MLLLNIVASQWMFADTCIDAFYRYMYACVSVEAEAEAAAASRRHNDIILLDNIVRSILC